MLQIGGLEIVCNVFVVQCLFGKETYMSRFKTVLASLASCFLVSAAFADTISVSPSLAPNAFGSPSFAGYQSNAVSALENGQTANGNPNDPTYYRQVTGPLAISQNIVTNFGAWNGKANPAGAYANELGNRLTFGLDAVATPGTTFSISDLSFSATSSDVSDSLGFDFGAGSYTYTSSYIGINYGADGVRGGGDDTFITSGPNTQLVNEIVGRGSGNAWAVLNTDPGLINQDKINVGANAIWNANGGNPITFTGTYSIGATSGSGSVLFDSPTAVPLPATASLGLLFFVSLGIVHGFRRYRQPALVTVN